MQKRKLRRINGRAKSARIRVLVAAKRKGSITNLQAKRIGRWAQSWYHLDQLCQAHLLKHAGFNKWKPTKKALTLLASSPGAG